MKSGPLALTQTRRVRLVRSDAHFHPERVDPVYSRYRRVGDLSLDESFFPIVCARDGYRTPWLVDDQHVAVGAA